MDTLDIKGAAGVMYCAGAESVCLHILSRCWSAHLLILIIFKTWSTMSVFLIAMVLHPECQARAQKEIDSIVGSGRLPEFSDRSSLPYVEGILQETLRYVRVLSYWYQLTHGMEMASGRSDRLTGLCFY